MRDDEDSILPLINVVFLLLIFFMIAGRLMAADPFEVTPPSSPSEQDAGFEGALLTLAADGRIAFQGEVVPKARLKGLLAALDADAPLRIKADAALPANKLLEILDELRAAGIEKVTLMTAKTP